MNVWQVGDQKEFDMSAATSTPRVRSMVVCDEVISSEIEDKVFTLENARQQRRTDALPCLCELSVFLVLSSQYQGDFLGLLVLRNDRAEIIQSRRFLASFAETNDLVPVFVEMDLCEFAELGRYMFEAWFVDQHGEHAQKWELPFLILPYEE
jgi:hypothetical protein